MLKYRLANLDKSLHTRKVGFTDLAWNSFSALPLNKVDYNTNKQKKLLGLSPRANSTDLATAACSTKLVSTFANRTMSRGQRGGSPRLYPRFIRPKPLLFLPNSSSFVLTRPSGPVPDQVLLRKSGSVGNRIRASGSVARNSAH
jgi:hypothetical protein